MLVRIHAGEAGEVRPGDAVFSWTPKAKYPLHVGVHVGERPVPVVRGEPTIVLGLPYMPKATTLGVAWWEQAGQYRVSAVGARTEDADPIAVKRIALLARSYVPDLALHPTSDRVKWDEELEIDETRSSTARTPLFVRGYCSDFVEFLYEQAGLDLVRQDLTHPPGMKGRSIPSAQALAFHRGVYPLKRRWRAEYADYPDCLDDRADAPRSS